VACAAVGIDRMLFRRAEKARSQGRKPHLASRPKLLSSDEEQSLIEWIRTYFINEGEDPEISDVVERVRKPQKIIYLFCCHCSPDNATFQAKEILGQRRTSDPGVQIPVPSEDWARKWISRSENLKLMRPRLIEPVSHHYRHKLLPHYHLTFHHRSGSLLVDNWKCGLAPFRPFSHGVRSKPGSCGIWTKLT